MASAPSTGTWSGQEEQAICAVVLQLVQDNVNIQKTIDFYEAASETLRTQHNVHRSANAVSAKYGKFRERAGVDERQYINSRLKQYPSSVPDTMQQGSQDWAEIARQAMAESEQRQDYDNTASGLGTSPPQGQEEDVGGKTALPDRTRGGKK